MKRLITLIFIFLSFIVFTAKAQYCVPTYFFTSNSNNDINNFTLSGAFNTSIIDTNTGCNSTGYDNRIGIIPPVTLQQGGTYNGTITTNNVGNENVRIWIDFDSDQVFSPSEEVTNFGPFGTINGVWNFQLHIPFSVPANVTRRMRVRLVYLTNSSTIDPCISYTFGETQDYEAYIAATPACSGIPVAGSISPSGPIIACEGTALNLTSVGSTFASGLTYQWEQSSNAGNSWNNAVGTGATTLYFHTPPMLNNIKYRLRVGCGIASDTTGSLNISVSGPPYASLPYQQDFEHWVSFCSTSDVPSINWLNTPSTGDSSWRRDDQGVTALWTSLSGGAYLPAAHSGSHSARFHGSAGYHNRGKLDLNVDASSPGSSKELQFYFINPMTNGSDSLNIYLSTNGGASFTKLSGFDTATYWTYKEVPFTSTSAQTIIRFEGLSDTSDDIGLDDVKVVLPCSGMPDAGTVNSATPCPNQAFNLALSGNTAAAGLSYLWQRSTNGTTWSAVAGGTSQVSSTTIAVPTYFRAIVTCPASGLSDTSTAVQYNVGSFYYCYCHSASLVNADENIGNVTIQKEPSGAVVLNNGIAIPTLNNPMATNAYTDYTDLPVITLYKDSIYRFVVSQITSSATFHPSYAGIWIDYNHNGIFDSWERIMLKSTMVNTTEAVDTFQIPDSAQAGITGMRVILSEGTAIAPYPCGQYSDGETEDYLIKIVYPPCSGTPDAGIAHISDTLVCPGTLLYLMDTTHTSHYSGLTTIWQSSTDGVNYMDIPGSLDKDTTCITASSTSTYYRFSIKCASSQSTATSNSLKVSLKYPYQCYCRSYSTGGIAGDSTDIGAFAIGNFVINTSGGHLNNASATKSYTDNTGSGSAILYADSTYFISAYEILRGAHHADAKLTLFIDLNNNQQYDIPEERVWTGYATSGSYYLTSTVTIPANAVTSVLTGMRLIINNDTGPNMPSDDGCGLYTSGETEDYLVNMKPHNSTGVAMVANGIDAMIYPNPTAGVITIRLNAVKDLQQVQISVVNITGQQMMIKEFAAGSKQFDARLDLSAFPRGVYMIHIQANGNSLVRKIVVN